LVEYSFQSPSFRVIEEDIIKKLKKLAVDHNAGRIVEKLVEFEKMSDLREGD
jgi:hypothetical protein